MAAGYRGDHAKLRHVAADRVGDLDALSDQDAVSISERPHPSRIAPSPATGKAT